MTSSSILRSVSVSAVCPNGKVWSYRTRAPVGNLKTDGFTPRHSRASASNSRSASHLLQVVGKLRTAIERTNSLVVLAVRPFISSCEGHRRLICNLFGTLSARSSSFLSFVHDANQPTNGIFRSFEISPVLPSAVAHGDQHRRRNGQSAVKG